MKNPYIPVFFIFTLCTRLYAQFPLTLTDVLGRPVTFPAPSQRIVSLSPGVTELLFAVGAGAQVVGVTEYCNYPPEAAKRAKVGGFAGITVQVERLVLLKPDLVILSGEMHERIIALLDTVGVKSFAVEPSTFAEVYQTIATIGRLTGHEREAERVVADMRAKIARAAVARGEKQRATRLPTVFWELSEEPLMSAGGKTFISEAISLAGGKNIFEELPERWPIVSSEQVLFRNPDWIIAGDDHGVSAAMLARRPGWAALAAVRERRVALVSADILYRYGPRLADAVLAISKILWGLP
jgi:iron complex transport system substrate-binding protein